MDGHSGVGTWVERQCVGGGGTPKPVGPGALTCSSPTVGNNFGPRTPISPIHGTVLATLLYRILALILTGLAVTAQAVRLDSLFGNFLGMAGAWAGQTTVSFMTVAIVDASLTAVSAAVALVLMFRGDPDRGARPLGLAMAVWSYLLAYSALVAFMRPLDPMSMARLAFEAHFLLVEMVGMAALIRWASVVPRPLTPADLRDPGELPVLVRPIQAVRGALLSAPVLWGGTVAFVVVVLVVNGLLGQPAQDAALLWPVDVVRFAALALVVTYMRRAYLRSNAAERRSLHWVALGFVVLIGSLGALIGGNVLFTVTGWTVPVVNWRPVVLASGVAAMMVLIGRSVLPDSGRDPAPAVRRGLILSILVLATLLLAAAFEALLSDAVVARLSLPGGLGTLLALALVGLLRTRLRGPLEQMFDQVWRGLPEPGDAG
ncbi:MAG: hypothetical protein RH859_06595 [Longimicrobiales bacterium]